MKITDSDLQEILTHALETMKEEEGAEFELNKVNLAELSRRTNISRHKLRKLKRDGFRVRANGNKGRKAETTVMTGCRIQFFSKPNPKKQQAQSDETGRSPRRLQIDLISEQEAVWCSEIDWDQSASGSIFCKSWQR